MDQNFSALYSSEEKNDVGGAKTSSAYWRTAPHKLVVDALIRMFSAGGQNNNVQT